MSGIIGQGPLIDIANIPASDLPTLIKVARNRCWESGDLRFKLDSTQQSIYDEIFSNEKKRFILECARRLGKSYLLCVLALEYGIKFSKSRILFMAPTYKEITELLIPLFDQITDDCPENIKPKFDRYSGHVQFANGSNITLAGCEDKRKANRGRGPGADLVIIDEAGFLDILDYVVHSIVNPQTLTTGGRVILASTPSDIPDHPFTKMAEIAEREGNYAHRTIYDNPRITDSVRQQYLENDAADLGMSLDEYKESDIYQREWLARRVVDRSLVVIPEWGEKREDLRSVCIAPQFFDAYVGLDFGGVDPHAAVFGYWDYQAGALVVESELLLREGENTAQLAEKIKNVEGELWGVEEFEGRLRGGNEWTKEIPDWLLRTIKLPKPPSQPYLRVCDNNIQLARDLASLHGIAFLPTEKHEKRLQINALRLLIREGRLKIQPRCVHLDRHLRTTVWKDHRMQDYKRKSGEHGDLLDALVYLVRNLRRDRDPTPLNHGVNPFLQHVRDSQKSSSAKNMAGKLAHALHLNGEDDKSKVKKKSRKIVPF